VKMRVEIPKVPERLHRHHAAGHGVIKRERSVSDNCPVYPGRILTTRPVIFCRT
jgi:hypothetical protein